MLEGQMLEGQLRLRALELAHDLHRNLGTAADVVASARVYLDFLRGTRDAEVIDAAQVLAEKVNRRA